VALIPRYKESDALSYGLSMLTRGDLSCGYGCPARCTSSSVGVARPRQNQGARLRRVIGIDRLGSLTTRAAHIHHSPTPLFRREPPNVGSAAASTASGRLHAVLACFVLYAESNRCCSTIALESRDEFSHIPQLSLYRLGWNTHRTHKPHTGAEGLLRNRRPIICPERMEQHTPFASRIPCRPYEWAFGAAVI